MPQCPGATSCTGATAYTGHTYATNGSGHRYKEDRVAVPDPGSYTYTYDAADQLKKEVFTAPGGATTTTHHTYTPEGQFQSQGRTWNVLGQMIGATVSGATAFGYDGFGNRSAP